MAIMRPEAPPRQQASKALLVNQLCTSILRPSAAGEAAVKDASANAYRSLATSRAIEVLSYSSVKESLKQQLGAGKNADGVTELCGRIEKLGSLTGSKLASALELLAHLAQGQTQPPVFPTGSQDLPAAPKQAPSKQLAKQGVAGSRTAPGAGANTPSTAALSPPASSKEPAKVQQVLQVLEGFDTEAIKLGADGLFQVDLGPEAEEADMISRLCEAGRLYRDVRSLAECQQSLGKLSNALNAAVKKELANYTRLLAELHDMAQTPLQAPGGLSTGPDLDLCMLDVLLRHSSERLAVLAKIMQCATQSPGSIAALLHSFTLDGSHLTAIIAESLLQQVCVPLFQMIREWLFSGSLDDPNQEFFIAASQQQAATAAELWRDGYHIEPSRLPPFISRQTAEAILRAGKSIHFLLKWCGDSAWVIDWATSPAAMAAANRISLGKVDVLDSVVADACTQVDHHLMEVITTRFHFARHCDVLRRYLLLGQGDYVQALLELVEPVSAAQATDLLLGDLLKQAISSISPPAEDEEVLDLLMARKAQATGTEHAWQVFTLQYNISGPLGIVLEPAREQYLQMFTLLWQFKRAEYALDSAFQMLKCSIARSLSKLREGTSQAMAVAKLFLQFRSTMMHFCTTMETYLMTDVVDSANHKFCRELATCSNLDQLVACHRRMMEDITSKALFGYRDVRPAIDKIIGTILRFQGVVNSFDTLVTEALIQTRRHHRSVEQRTASGQWGSVAGQGAVVPPADLAKLRKGLEALQAEYCSALDKLTSSIPINLNGEMPYLVARLKEGTKGTAAC